MQYFAFGCEKMTLFGRSWVNPILWYVSQFCAGFPPPPVLGTRDVLSGRTLFSRILDKEQSRFLRFWYGEWCSFAGI